jgi:phage tail sheath protein FI
VLQLLDEFDSAPLLALHQALTIACQARGDVMGILTLAQHFEKRQCIEWQEDLRQRLGLPPRRSVFNDVRDIADLSYMAVYHPWLLVSDTNAPDRLRAVPCDGVVCGMIAARERQRQVWVAPANVPLQGVLGLIPAFATDDWADLFALQFNLVRPEPRDFRGMSAHTLSDERAWLQISVRRLLILLRKLALDRGMDFVFESNHERFREGVRVMLEEVLQFMFERGAFAGATADQAFRVVTDDSINTAQSIAQGRFIVQLLIAPSQPMEFITVQLTRTGEGSLLAVEV